jgi:hypothetical protein
MSDKDKGGAKADAAAAQVPLPGEITAPENALRDVLLPAVIIVVSLIFVLASIKIIQPDCSSDGFFILAFAILFGAAGSLFGGKIGVMLNIPSTSGLGGGVRAVGGIAAAIAGWMIAFLTFPGCVVNWNSQITIDQIPMAQPRDRDDNPKYFATVAVSPTKASASDWSRPPDVVISQDNDSRGILQFRLASTGNKVVFRLFRRETDNSLDAKDDASKKPKLLYSFLGSCQFTIEPAGTTELTKSATVFSTKSSKILLQFRSNYLETLQEKNDLSQPGAILNKCVEGYFTDVSGRAEAERVFENPLRFKIERSLLGKEEIVLSFAKQVAKLEDLQNPTTLKDATVKSAKDDSTVVSNAGKTEVVGIPGSAPNPAQKTLSQDEQISAPPIASDLLQQKAACVKDEARKVQILSYLGGSDLDQTQRFDLYKNWDQFSCLVLTALENDGRKLSSRIQGRALRLLASAVINNSGEANPTYWQPGAGKRDLSQPLPKYVESKYIQLIVNLVGSVDDYVRAEAVRFVKLVPNNQIEALFQEKFKRMVELNANPNKEFFAIGATALYYNRIVEWLNVPDAAKASLKNAAANDVAKDFAAGQDWTRDDLFSGRSAKPFFAMLLYAKAIVQREMSLGEDRGKTSFSQMLSTLRSTSEPYPSRAQHIGQALILSSSLPEGTPQQRNGLRAVQAATEFDLVRTLDGKDPFTSKSYALSLAPDIGKTEIQMFVEDNGRLLLQSGDWYLVNGKGKIGWIRSTQPKS